MKWHGHALFVIALFIWICVFIVLGQQEKISEPQPTHGVIVLQLETSEPAPATPAYTETPACTPKLEHVHQPLRNRSPTPTSTPTPTPTPTPLTTSIPIFNTPKPTTIPTPVPTSTPTPSPTPTPEPEWIYYLATSYSLKTSECGNKGAVLTGKKVVAMWQTDTSYAQSCVEPFRTWYKTHNGLDYGALPYGTKMEMRYWNGSSYVYMGIYELLDTSYTTIYALSETARSLSGTKAPLRFTYNWPSTNYKGAPSEVSGLRWGHLSNWKSEYSGRVVGWMDVLDANWGMVIVEIRVL